PLRADRRVADVVLHRARARREERDVAAPLPLQLQLGLLQAVADLVIADPELLLGDVLLGDLPLAPVPQGLRRGRVVAVAVDDHRSSSSTVKRRGIICWRYTQSIATSRLRRFSSRPNGFISGLPAASRLLLSSAKTSWACESDTVLLTVTMWLIWM